MSMTQQFTEVAQLLGEIVPASHSTEQNTGYVSLANFYRWVVLIHAAAAANDIDVDIEQGTTTAGAGAKTYNTNAKDVTVTATTETTVVIEDTCSNFDVANAFDCLNVEATPAGARVFGLQVWGFIPRYAPVATTLIDEIA